MATPKITELIDKSDNMELVRDEIAAILALEIGNQKTLAIAAGRDGDLWDFDVYSERTSPWELVEDADGKIIRQTPLVNVYLASANNNGASGDDVNLTAYNVVIHIDCLSAKAHKTIGGVMYRGDILAALDVQRVARLVRNILMAGIYRRLIPGVVTARSIQSITMFQPNINDRPAQHCVGARLVYACTVNEYSPQYDGPELELVSGAATRGEDGVVLFDADFETTEET
jgi:hypothetical protein